MDKQTAIDLLDNLLGMVEDNHESDYDTAIHMGIDALKSNAPNALSALDCIERQATIDALCDNCDTVDAVCAHIPCKRYISIENLPSVQTNMSGNMSGTHKSLDCISRQAAIDALEIEKTYSAVYKYGYTQTDYFKQYNTGLTDGIKALNKLPSAQPEQRYTEEELMVFRHGISLSLLSKRSAQHWRYDEDTATEIEFLERLYDKVSADMRGEQDDESRSNSNAQTDTRARGMGATDKSSGI